MKVEFGRDHPYNQNQSKLNGVERSVDMYDHVSAGGGVLARAITYARSRFRLV